MRILVIGGGGREHAVVKKISESPKSEKIWCAPGNAGIADLAECVNIKATDIPGIVAFALENNVDFVVITPDDPLALGMADALNEVGIKSFGPTKRAAIIEGSKSFSKKLMKKHGIPTASFEVFDDMKGAVAYVKKVGAPIVIKADGLALGKGVTVANTVDEALTAVKNMMEDRAFGDSGARVVIEECLSGPEVTLMCFYDGETVSVMPSSQDHKRVNDGDSGPNTGGMGAISPSPFFTAEMKEYCIEKILIPVFNALKEDGRPYKGVLYAGLMLTKDGPKVIEFNARFGDPETQAVLSLLKSDLLEILLSVSDGTLSSLKIVWDEGAACCVVLASGGYPSSYRTGFKISGLDAVGEGISVFHAGTKKEGSDILTSGGRVLGVTATGPNLEDAVSRAYNGVKSIKFENMHFRTDIGKNKRMTG